MFMKKEVIEAALFISSEPIPIDRLSKISGIHSLGHLKEVLEDLQKDYSKKGINIIKTNDGWMMNVRQDILPTVAHLTPYSDLAEGQKRTLALVAYKEPVKQADIIKIQGNKAYTYIKDLVRRGLIKTEKVGHTKILSLTQEFERYFGEEKAKIKERLEDYTNQPEPEKTKEKEEEYQFKDEKKGKKDKVKVVKADEEDVPQPENDEETEEPENPQPDQPQPENNKTKGSHNHAFKEIE